MGEIKDVSVSGLAVLAPLPDMSSAAPPVSYQRNFHRFSKKDSLALWHRVTMETVINQTPDLTSRQLAMLMSVYLDEGPHTVRSLAAKLQVTKAVITRGVDRLCKLDFIKRMPDHRDKRSVIMTRTSAGIRYLSHFAEIIQLELPQSHLRR